MAGMVIHTNMINSPLEVLIVNVVTMTTSDGTSMLMKAYQSRPLILAESRGVAHILIS